MSKDLLIYTKLPVDFSPLNCWKIRTRNAWNNKNFKLSFYFFTSINYHEKHVPQRVQSKRGHYECKQRSEYQISQNPEMKIKGLEDFSANPVTLRGNFLRMR